MRVCMCAKWVVRECRFENVCVCAQVYVYILVVGRKVHRFIGELGREVSEVTLALQPRLERRNHLLLLQL